jgi:diguanylate cyclase (GGDEF)-like protein/PAS domain S-box-containing protein
MDEIIARSPIGIAVIDHEGIYRTINPAYCAIYGYARDELLGHSFTLVFPPTRREWVLGLHQTFLDVGGELKGEWDVVHRDGVRLNVYTESVRYPGEDGRTRRLVYVVDITQRKQMELALKSSHQFAQSVLDGLLARICVLDESGIIVAVNRAWREFAGGDCQRTVTVHEGAPYLGVCGHAPAFPHEDGHESDAFVSQLNEVLAGRLQQFQLEYPCHSANERRWFVARVARIEDSDPPRIVVAHDDVTALKQAQETLRQSEALLLDMAASIPGTMFRLLVHPPSERRLVYVSPGIEALFEVTPAQACSDSEALWNCILPDDRPEHEASVRAAAARKGPWQNEFRIRTRSGVVKWIHARAEPKPGDGEDVVWTGVLTDVSDRKHIEAVLKASEETYRTLFETVPQGVVYQDVTGRISSANPAAQRILGLTLDQLQGRTSIDPRWKAMRENGGPLPGEDHPAMQALRTGRPVEDVVMGISVPDRGHVWIMVSATPLFRNGRLDGVYSSFEDITQQVLLSKELKLQATTDYLTGASNRRSLMERLTVEFERVQRHPDLQCSVLALDLDFFKRVNDTWGHATGDAMLVHVSKLMRQETRVLDVVARSGGEEFTVLLPHTGLDEAMALGERLRIRVETSPLQHEEHTIAITVSIGVSAIAATDASADAVLARADRALYEAKNSGRNAVRLAAVPD